MIFRKSAVMAGVKPRVMIALEVAEGLSGLVWTITSAYREGDELAHGEGLAVDIACADSGERDAIHESLKRVGFRRIGLYDRHVHADLSDSLPQDKLWLGVSR